MPHILNLSRINRGQERERKLGMLPLVYSVYSLCLHFFCPVQKIFSAVQHCTAAGTLQWVCGSAPVAGRWETFQVDDNSKIFFETELLDGGFHFFHERSRMRSVGLFI